MSFLGFALEAVIWRVNPFILSANITAVTGVALFGDPTDPVHPGHLIDMLARLLGG